jgi:hypothetical protein
VEIETVPPLAGVRVRLGDQEATTGADGTASLTTSDLDDTAGRLVVIDRRVPLPGGGGHHELSRVFGESGNLVLGFDLYREVSFTFRTRQGRLLGTEEIDSLQLKNTLGGRYDDVDRQRPVLLHANRAVASPGGPVIRDIVWSIDSVMVGTANVVNRSEYRFTPASETDIEVTTLFYDAEVVVNDLFFGFPTGRTLLVEHPDGRITEHGLRQGSIHLEDLPRGAYRVAVDGGPFRLWRPVALSRDQVVDVALLSRLDLGVAAAALATFVVGTMWIGLRRRRRSGVARSWPPPDPALVPAAACPPSVDGHHPGSNGAAPDGMTGRLVGTRTDGPVRPQVRGRAGGLIGAVIVGATTYVVALHRAAVALAEADDDQPAAEPVDRPGVGGGGRR